MLLWTARRADPATSMFIPATWRYIRNCKSLGKTQQLLQTQGPHDGFVIIQNAGWLNPYLKKTIYLNHSEVLAEQSKHVKQRKKSTCRYSGSWATCSSCTQGSVSTAVGVRNRGQIRKWLRSLLLTMHVRDHSMNFTR